MIGTTVSNYKIIEKRGAGGMGEVFLAEDGKLITIEYEEKHADFAQEQIEKGMGMNMCGKSGKKYQPVSNDSGTTLSR